jgi:hypothetical protein
MQVPVGLRQTYGHALNELIRVLRQTQCRQSYRRDASLGWQDHNLNRTWS